MTQHDYNEIARIVSEVLESIKEQDAVKPVKKSSNISSPVAGYRDLDPAVDFPLADKNPDLIKTPSGISLNDITMKKVLSGQIKADDLRISPETLELQAQIADKVGRKQLAANFRRSAELTKVSDERILEIYDALRPYRSTKNGLLAIADELENQYKAVVTAALVREAADVYDNRGLLK